MLVCMLLQSGKGVSLLSKGALARLGDLLGWVESVELELVPLVGLSDDFDAEISVFSYIIKPLEGIP